VADVAGAARPLALLAPVLPLVGGAAQFNTALLTALRERGPVTALTWRRLYPPLLHRRSTHDHRSQSARIEPAVPVLDWLDPRTWRRAMELVRASAARALILPWVHPVITPQYAYLLAVAPEDVTKVVICHNVLPHERVPLSASCARAVLGKADVIVSHSGPMRNELGRLGVDARIVDAFHPRFSAHDLAALPSPEAIARERVRQGQPDLSLIAFGAVRPYKGFDIAIRALAQLDCRLRVRLTIAGVFWDGGAELQRLVAELALEDRVELRDGFVSNEDAALLFSAADAAILPYRSATQSGVVQLAFAYGIPVLATSVGGLPEAVSDGVDGLLCQPEDPQALAAIISRLTATHATLAAGVAAGSRDHSFQRYSQLLEEALV
jgi:glycosyltransferase involved in cell wall biosynthesis